MNTWLVVDLGGVAAHFHPDRRLAALADLTGLTTTQLQDRLFDSGFDRAAESGLHTEESIADAVLYALDHKATLEQLVTAWALAFGANRDVLQFVSDHPARSCLFTNNGPMLDLCLRGPLSTIAKPFNRIVCSWHARAAKPSAEAFAYVESTLGARNEELLLIDDDDRNTRAARSRGWQIHHYTSFEALQNTARRHAGPFA